MVHRHKHRRRNSGAARLPARTNDFGVAHALSVAKNESPAGHASKPSPRQSESSEGEWQTAPSRKRKRPADASSPSDSKGNYPSIKHSSQARLHKQVNIADLQSLVLYLLADGPSPQWVAVSHHKHVRKVVVLMVPGLERAMFDGSIALEANSPKDQNNTSTSVDETAEPVYNQASLHAQSDPAKAPPRKLLSPDDYYPSPLVADELPAPLKPLSDVFDHMWPVKTPGDDKMSKIHSPIAAMVVSPLPKSQEMKNHSGPKPPREPKGWENEPTPVTHFLASVQDLRDNGYVIHKALLKSDEDENEEMQKRERDHKTDDEGWVESNVTDLPQFDASTSTSPTTNPAGGWNILAVDCEMCQTGPDRFELTRVSIVDWDKTVVMDELVKPANPITDYLTQYSGITKEKLDPITTTLADIQKRLLTLLTSWTILLGHSLDSDLNALKLAHPAIIDTSILYPHPRGPPLKSSLKWLVQKYLQRDIQKGGKGHDSTEDASAALDLVKLKCKRGPKWGTVEATTESIFKRLSRSKNASGSDDHHTGAVVDWGFPKRGYGSSADVCIGCENDDEIVAGIKRATLGDADGGEVPGGGVDFVWARMRELEARREWWNSSKTADNEALLETTLGRSSAPTSETVDTTPSKTFQLQDDVSKAILRIKEIYNSLPPCTTFIVYSGTGDPTELARLQAVHQTFKREYAVKKWDELSVHWTDVEEQALKAALRKARQGIAFVTVK